MESQRLEQMKNGNAWKEYMACNTTLGILRELNARLIELFAIVKGSAGSEDQIKYKQRVNDSLTAIVNTFRHFKEAAHNYGAVCSHVASSGDDCLAAVRESVLFDSVDHPSERDTDVSTETAEELIVTRRLLQEKLQLKDVQLKAIIDRSRNLMLHLSALLPVSCEATGLEEPSSLSASSAMSGLPSMTAKPQE